ncbi:MAG: hypothetical protein R2780_09695 [Crocinitomicaceae bacterium]
MKKSLYILACLALFSCGGSSSENESLNENDQVFETTEEVIEEVIEEVSTCETDGISVYLSDPDESGTNIRNAPNGDVVGQLVKDEEDNMEFFITALEAKDGWIRIENKVENMGNAFEFNEGGECWIHGSVLGVDTRNYGNQVISMHADPDHESAEVGKIDKEMYGLHPLDKCGKWMKFKVNGTTGWVHEEWLCGNPLTTCS